MGIPRSICSSLIYSDRVPFRGLFGEEKHDVVLGEAVDCIHVSHVVLNLTAFTDTAEGDLTVCISPRLRH